LEFLEFHKNDGNARRALLGKHIKPIQYNSNALSRGVQPPGIPFPSPVDAVSRCIRQNDAANQTAERIMPRIIVIGTDPRRSLP